MPGTLADVCAPGMAAETGNARLHDEDPLPAVAGHAGITRVFTNLRCASINMHLPAFERCAAGGGHRDGNGPGNGRRLIGAREVELRKD